MHDLRARCDAILVGVGTVLADDPLLNVRGRESLRPLLRVVLDRKLRTPLSSRLVQSVGTTGLLVCCGRDADEGKATTLRAAGVRVGIAETLTDALSLLYRLGVTNLLVEPGPTLAAAFFDHGAVDRVWVFRAGEIVGGAAAVAAAPMPARIAVVGSQTIGRDSLGEYLDTSSRAYFALERSADFRRLDQSLLA